ncbi:Calponin-homology (CH) domain-containing protein [Entamoeba marina]
MDSTQSIVLTLTRWMNYTLREVRMEQIDFSTFSDGLLLKQLFELLTENQINSFFPTESYIDCVYNNQQVIQLICGENITVSPELFTQGNPDDVTTVLMQLIIKHQLHYSSFEEAKYYVLGMVEKVVGKEIFDLRYDWPDGSLFRAFLVNMNSSLLLNSYYCQLQNPEDIIRISLDEAQNYFGIVPLLDIEQMCHINEEFSLILYLSYFSEAVREFTLNDLSTPVSQYDYQLTSYKEQNYSTTPQIKPKKNLKRSVNEKKNIAPTPKPSPKPTKTDSMNIFEEIKENEDFLFTNIKQISNWYSPLIDKYLYHSCFILWTPPLSLDINFPKKLLKKANNNDNVEEMYQLGCCLLKGYLFEKSEALAYSYFIKAAKKSHKYALNNAALMEERGIGVPCSYRLARKHYKEALKYGCMTACNNTAVLGMIFEENEVSANNFQFCVKHGVIAAYNNLAVMTLQNKSDVISKRKAIEYLIVASNSGDEYAMFNLSQVVRFGVPDIVPRSISKSVRILENISLLPYGLYNMGFYYQTGIAVKKNPKLAAKLYLKAKCSKTEADVNIAVGLLFGEFGNHTTEDDKTAMKILHCRKSSIAQFHMGRCYRKGVGVEKNANKSAEMYKKSMKNGNTFAPFHVACVMLIKHEGSDGEAISLIQQAVDNGYWAAKSWLGRKIYHENMTLALVYLNEAAKMDDKRACYALAVHYLKFNENESAVFVLKYLIGKNDINSLLLLGVCYMKGKGVDKDLNEAIHLWRRAKTLGSEKANEFLKACQM